jgi:mRNA interferase RelE/StbE
MAKFEIEFRRSVEKDLRKIPRNDQIRILRQIDGLRQEPFPSGSKKLSKQERYRLRQGNYRILYEVQEEKLIIVVVKVKHRRDAYR